MRPLVILALLVLALRPAAADEPGVPQSREELQLTLAPVVRQAAPAVVNVYSAATVAGGSPLFEDPVLRQLFGDRFGPGFGGQRTETSLGSGVIVSPDGWVVTNYHVIKHADQVTVILADGREFEAQIALADERTDLAVLRIDTDGETLPYLEFRDSDTLEVGDLVLAIGNPFGVGQTVTLGIVSALARTQVGVSDYSFFIQTDAAINPGNSGGALVTLDGRLVGINTAIYSRSGGSIGIGFAVPANMVRTVVQSAESGQPIERPWAGVVGEALTAELAATLKLPRPGGVVVAKLYPGGPAARAGLVPGDIILKAAGQPVIDPKALAFRLATLGVGQEAELEILRAGKPLVVRLALEPAPEEPEADIRALAGRQPLAGAAVANLSPALAEELGLGDRWQGVIVLRVEPGSSARRLRLRPGDIVRELNGRAVESTADLEEHLSQAVEGWRITIERDGRLITAEIPS